MLAVEADDGTAGIVRPFRISMAIVREVAFWQVRKVWRDWGREDTEVAVDSYRRLRGGGWR